MLLDTVDLALFSRRNLLQIYLKTTHIPIIHLITSLANTLIFTLHIFIRWFRDRSLYINILSILIGNIIQSSGNKAAANMSLEIF